jgi:hypothetical protein
MDLQTHFEQALRNNSVLRTPRELGFTLADVVMKLWNEGVSQSVLLEGLEEFRSAVPTEDHEDSVLDIMDLVYDDLTDEK